MNYGKRTDHKEVMFSSPPSPDWKIMSTLACLTNYETCFSLLCTQQHDFLKNYLEKTGLWSEVGEPK